MNNPAYERLLQDYVDYHLALVVVGGFFTVVLLGFAMFSWLRARNAPKGVERRTHLAFALASSVVGLLLAVVVAGNLSNVLNPQQGLAGAIGTPGDLKPAASAELTTSLRQWLRSGSADVPTVIQQQVDARLAWQEPKAVISTVVLLVVVAASIALWRSVITRSRQGQRVRGRVLVGSAAAFASFVVMLMVMGNTQASYAPITMTLLFG
ncbi:MAG: hypothetical protein KDC40_04945 [Actinobacteria bacterium]|nr:hypothetical protein [Actinomycetota bacterium]